jgi:hypothetical protein
VQLLSCEQPYRAPPSAPTGLSLGSLPVGRAGGGTLNSPNRDVPPPASTRVRRPCRDQAATPVASVASTPTQSRTNRTPTPAEVFLRPSSVSPQRSGDDRIGTNQPASERSIELAPECCHLRDQDVCVNRLKSARYLRERAPKDQLRSGGEKGRALKAARSLRRLQVSTISPRSLYATPAGTEQEPP